MPVFAFANAGLPLAGLTLSSLVAPLPLGIVAGLFLGKQIGILPGAATADRARHCAHCPPARSGAASTAWRSCGGIGFTMSLFIGTLAFGDAAHDTQVRLGVLAGSLLSALVGYLALRFAPRR